MSLKRMLIVGGTAYVGQHLLQSLAICCEARPPFSLAFTYNTEPPPQLLLNAFPHVLPFHVDMRPAMALTLSVTISHRSNIIAESCKYVLIQSSPLSSLWSSKIQPDDVINCAAISVPRACEMDPESAMAINVATALVKWLLSCKENKTLLIHLSPDQVCEGTKSFYKEEDDVVPVNVYGKSKVEAGRCVSAKYPNFAILRSSIIYGPQTIAPLPKSLPIQWMDSVLAKGEALDFFHDEFHCPVYVKDLVNVIRILIDQWISERKQMQLLLNIGGPDRMSGVQMAEAVANIRGYNTSLINEVSASSVDRGVQSPADIFMDVTKLIRTLGVTPTSYTEGVTLTLYVIPWSQQ